jgi:hypothetical protein
MNELAAAALLVAPGLVSKSRQEALKTALGIKKSPPQKGDGATGGGGGGGTGAGGGARGIGLVRGHPPRGLQKKTKKNSSGLATLLLASTTTQPAHTGAGVTPRN